MRNQLEENIDLEKKLLQTEKTLMLYTTELKVLNAQIKPHFLSNVIGTAMVLCATKPDLAAFMLEKLAVYLNGLINCDKETVSVKEELDIVRAYLAIQAIRMGERLQFSVNADAEVQDSEIPVLSIQTLVENAVIHGLGDKEEGGKIVINVVPKQYKKRLLVEVHDNGVGIAQDKLEGLLSNRELENIGKKRRSVGIWNVQRRLQLLGSDGLYIFSERGDYTKVCFEIAFKEE